MNFQPLYQAVHESTAPPTQEQLQQLGAALFLLPGKIHDATLKHYVRGQSLQAIASEMGVHPSLVNIWRGHGIAILKLWTGVVPVE